MQLRWTTDPSPAVDVSRASAGRSTSRTESHSKKGQEKKFQVSVVSTLTQEEEIAR